MFSKIQFIVIGARVSRVVDTVLTSNGHGRRRGWTRPHAKL